MARNLPCGRKLKQTQTVGSAHPLITSRGEKEMQCLVQQVVTESKLYRTVFNSMGWRRACLSPLSAAKIWMTILLLLPTWVLKLDKQSAIPLTLLLMRDLNCPQQCCEIMQTDYIFTSACAKSPSKTRDDRKSPAIVFDSSYYSALQLSVSAQE